MELVDAEGTVSLGVEPNMRPKTPLALERILLNPSSDCWLLRPVTVETALVLLCLSHLSSEPAAEGCDVEL